MVLESNKSLVCRLYYGQQKVEKEVVNNLLYSLGILCGGGGHKIN